MSVTSQQRIRVLHVDDEPDFTDLTRTFLEREDDRFIIETAPSADEGLERINDRPPDCVVSDYNMPGMDGLDFLQAVREEYPDLPFILFTGKGSEEVASDAIAADVTDYLQKGSGSEQYELLANRIRNAVQAQRETRRADRQEQLMRLTEFTGNTGGFELDEQRDTVLLTAGARRMIGHPDRHEIPSEEAIELFHPDDRADIQHSVENAFQTGEDVHTTWRLRAEDGQERLLDITITPVTENGDVTKLRGVGHDITDRRERQRELEKIETLCEHAQDAMFLIDAGEDFAIEWVNPAWEEKLGLPAERVRGQSPRTALGEKTGAATEEKYRECIQRREPLRYEEIWFEGGESHWMTQLAPVVVDGTVEYIAGSTRDITEQKERQRELTAERRFITQALDTLDDLFYVIDADGRLRRWNSRVPEITGYTESELDDMQVTELFPEDERERIANAIDTVITDGQNSTEADLLTADGERIPYEFTGARLTDDNGTTTGLVGIARDLTELRRRERRFQALVEESNDIISVLDANGVFTYQSPSVERILGYDSEETIGDTAWEYLHPDDREMVRDTFEEWVTNPEMTATVEYRARHADGSWRWMEARGNNQLDDPAVEGYVVNTRDVTERKKREQDLQRTRALMTNMEQLADAGAWEYDSGTESLMLTDGARRLYGLDPETDLTLEAAFDAVHPDDRDRLRDRFETCLQAGQPYEIDVRLITPDGEQRWITARGERVNKGESGNVIRGFIQDITEQTERRQELERRNDLFEKAQNIADIGAWAHDIERGTLTWTDQVYEIHGVSRDFNPSVEDVKELYHPEDQPKLSEAVNQAVTAGEPYDLEVRMTARDDGTRWIRTVADPHVENGDVVRVRGIVHDITDRVEREQELEQYEHFFKNSPDQIALLDENLTVQYQSPPSSLHELDAIEVEGDNPLEYVHPDDRQKLANQFEELVRTPGKSFAEEFRAKDVSGEWRWVESRTISLLNEEPADGILVMIRDITQRKRQQRKRKRQNERLDEFTRIVSHDLRSPLSVAEGHLELAQDSCESSHLAQAADALERSQALIEDLLTLAREGETVGDTEPVELTDVAESSWQTVETGAATLETHATRTLRADRTRLQQLFENLYRNAVEHSSTDVTVTVGAMEDGFYVADTGPGIPESDRERVFEPGYSTNEGGTGFGLRIVERIADAHGWDITVTESEAGGGRFEIRTGPSDRSPSRRC